MRIPQLVNLVNYPISPEFRANNDGIRHKAPDKDRTILARQLKQKGSQI